MLIVGSGGLSHQLDGERAGFINREFDLLCLDSRFLDVRRADKLRMLDVNCRGPLVLCALGTTTGAR